MLNNTSSKIKQNITYYKMLKDQMERHELRAKSIHFRRNLLERQTVANYTNELDRVRGELSKSVIAGTTRSGLLRRAEQLKKLGAEATSGIK
jgi:hypothetical protein